MPVSKQELWRRGWPDMHFKLRDTVVEVAMSRLRKMLEDETGRCLILAERGQGYRLDLEALHDPGI